jgi:Uma2 family endonuclease
VHIRLESNMSTVPERRAKNKASFRYGYREVLKKLAGGREKVVRLPLTLEDVLHPQFGDVHVLSDAHGDDCVYLRDVLRERYKDDPSVVVFHDVGIFWDLPRLKHHSPDITVIFGVKERKDWKTFDVKTEKVRPVLIIEITSPSTRSVDLNDKVRQYARAGVPHYVIADAKERNDHRKLTLISYKLVRGTYKPVKLDADGRAWLEPVNLWLGLRNDPRSGGERVALVDPKSNQEIGDYSAVNTARAEAEALARVALERAASEAQLRAKAEARVRELQEKLRRRNGRR